MLLLGLFYASNKKVMTAEGLYSEALQKLKDEDSFTKVMGLNLYGRLILKHHEQREKEATQYLKTSEEMAKRMPHWYDKLQYIYLPDFDLS